MSGNVSIFNVHRFPELPYKLMYSTLCTSLYAFKHNYLKMYIKVLSCFSHSIVRNIILNMEVIKLPFIKLYINDYSYRIYNTNTHLCDSRQVRMAFPIQKPA